MATDECSCSQPDYQDEHCPHHGRASYDSWDHPKYLKPDDCDGNGYCVHCGTATVHRVGCIMLAHTIEPA